MRWPWVAVARLDDLRAHYEARLADAHEQVAYLRERAAHLADQIVRMERAQLGLSEVPRAARPKMEPMPRELLEHCNGFMNPSYQKELRDRAFRRHGQGDTWDAIMADMMFEEEG